MSETDFGSPEFQQAAKDSRNLTKMPSDNELLELYGLYTIVKNPSPDKEPKKGGMFAFKENKKYESWKALKDEGVSVEDAEKRYIKLVEELKNKYGSK